MPRPVIGWLGLQRFDGRFLRARSGCNDFRVSESLQATKMQRKSAKRTFRVSGKMKYYLSKGRFDKRRETKVKKARFMSLVHQYNNRWLYFHVSGGKVVKMTVTSEH